MWKILELANVTSISVSFQVKDTQKIAKVGLILKKYVSEVEFAKLKVFDPSRDNKRD